jgi:hypothetical protein
VSRRMPFFWTYANATAALYRHTLWSLKKRVAELEENEIIENIMLRGSQISSDTPTWSDIDAIMQSMMGPSSGMAQVTLLRIRQQFPEFEDEIPMVGIESEQDLWSLQVHGSSARSSGLPSDFHFDSFHDRMDRSFAQTEAY